MAVVSWNAPTAWTAGFGTSDLNSLANGSVALSSLSAPQINTTSTLQLYLQFEFVGGSISPTVSADVVAFALPIDSANTTYMNGEAGATLANQPIWMQYPHAAIGLRAKAASTQLAMSMPVLIPPGKYTLGLLNRAGVALNASGNQINWRLITEQVT